MSRRAVEIDIVDAAGVAPFAASLAELERSITYPIDDGQDRFFIDHGEGYHRFFSTMGPSYFAIAHERGRVVGVLAGANRDVDWCGRRLPSFYLGDLKVAKEHRGERLVERMVLRALARIPFDARLRHWRVAYGAAMRDARGDVMKSSHRLHPLRLLRPLARLALYFEAPEKLARLDARGCPAPPKGAGADLSATSGAAPLVVSTAGRKDLRLVSTGAPWPLSHLPRGPSAWGASWGRYLAEAGASLAAEGSRAQACFAIDDRLADHVAWLEAEGARPGAVCTLYALAPALPPPAWVHLSTAEI